LTEGRVTRFGLLRHAETVWNRARLIQGQSDSPLSPAGREQARAWAERLRGRGWDRMLSSDLGRARETAALVNAVLGLPLCEDARLREQDWGRWVGRSLADLEREEAWALAAAEAEGWGFRPPGGEDRREVLERSRAALIEAAGRWPDRRVLVVTHEGVIKCLLYRFWGRRFAPGEGPPLTGYGLHVVVHDGQGLAWESAGALPLAGPAEPAP
jgi:broad specificity phosphatase PhoE